MSRRKLTTEEFIQRAKEIHGDKYDYSKVEYVGALKNVCIICKKHGEFWQESSNHLNKYGCPICKIENDRLTKEEFIKRASNIHNNKYDYSKVNYITNLTKVEIICLNHGSFWQRPSKHLIGNGCPLCFKERQNKDKLLSKEEFVERANKIHNNKYDYSKVNYVNNSIKVEIICKEHGEFWQTPSTHMDKRCGCPKCANNHRGEYHKLNNDSFIDKAKIIHGNKYDYSKVKYVNSHVKINIVCKKHGVFSQTPNSHLNGNGCPKCHSSVGERLIRVFFEQNDVIFSEQKIFDNCIYKRNLKFDFYIESLNLCIEFDGLYHFNDFSLYTINIDDNEKERLYNLTHKRDLVKNKYCKDNDINLIRIKYSDDLYKILYKILDCYKNNLYDKTLNYGGD